VFIHYDSAAERLNGRENRKQETRNTKIVSLHRIREESATRYFSEIQDRLNKGGNSMATTRREEVIDWLSDAYAMERGLQVMLRKQAENDEAHPAIRERARIHLGETKEHARRLERCLELLGSSASSVKSATGQTIEMGKGLMSKMARDERVKDFLAAYGAEYFEVACYKSLIAGARLARETEIVPLLESNLREDRAMAEWLDANVEVVTADYLVQPEMAGAAA
jgi:ferritin-like metal-binding protein YciE